MYVKGVYDKLTDSQRTVVDMLIADDKIYRTWNGLGQVVIVIT